MAEAVRLVMATSTEEHPEGLSEPARIRSAGHSPIACSYKRGAVRPQEEALSRAGRHSVQFCILFTRIFSELESRACDRRSQTVAKVAPKTKETREVSREPRGAR